MDRMTNKKNKKGEEFWAAIFMCHAALKVEILEIIVTWGFLIGLALYAQVFFSSFFCGGGDTQWYLVSVHHCSSALPVPTEKHW